ncbi:HD domain-containing protein [Streptomyces sp. SID12488]|uniref:HD domain-containing protein n=1 Tax=Streptomyces sp. SID12488 TaxID=2706040 RepID=UPI0013DB0A98|nr:HD domain-containing protein [Streptomyces sp. SID12488]NEA66187.1 HD domain-containing protein [Streptomyces sp. SID12488]
MTNTLLSKAVSGAVDPPLLPLPDRVSGILSELGSPPRLAAHLRAVHDVAHQLVDWVEQHCPAVHFDREAVLFGAATHDVGKTVHHGELSGPGSAHEEAGQTLLLGHGVSPDLARFAATHASWSDTPVGLEDLLVSLADKIWKNKRVPDLEDLVVARLTEASGRAAWEEFIALDEVLARIGDEADRRLAFQASFPVYG